jgi:transposase
MANLQVVKVKGINYYSIVECRRINKKPTPVTIAYLGNIENILKVFNSNKNTSADENYKSYSYGAVYSLWKIAQKHDIIKFLNNSFPEQTRIGLSRGQTLLFASIYRAIYPGSKNEFSEKIIETSLPSIAKFDPDEITSQHFWSQMHGIDEKMLYDAEDKIAEQILNYYNLSPSKLALDYTNYFTYINSNNKRCTIAERGHNKQKRDDLRQFSLGLVTTKELAIPLCSYVYEGNITDVTAFSKYLELFKKRISHYTDASDITLIYDNGSVSKKNLTELKGHEPKLHYVCAFSITSCKELLNISLDDYKTVGICGDKDILCYRTTKNIWGENRECILIYSEELYQGQYKGLVTSIEKKMQQLRLLKEQLKNSKSRISKKAADIDVRIKKIINGDFGESIFNINKSGIQIINDIDISVDYDIMSELCIKHYGKRVLITDQALWTTEEILESYWDQSAIENVFKDSKNRFHFSVQPQFHWTDSKVRVHTFCCLLGLLLTSLLRKELADAGIKMENKKIINLLSGIREVYILKPDKKAKSGFNVQKK